MKRSAIVLLAVTSSVLILTLMNRTPARLPVPDAFSANSYWNQSIPENVSINPRSDEIVSFLAADNQFDGCITLTGTGTNRWGMPIYLADSTSPEYEVTSSKYAVPPEFASLRIPLGALPADTRDAEMVVYDIERGLVAQLSKASFSAETNIWSVTGGSVAYLASNGLDGALTGSDEPRNTGSFRGYNGAVSAIGFDDVASGLVDNVIKIGVHNSRNDATPPMVGSDGDLEIPEAPSQGARIRIRPDLDLDALNLSPQALVIARGLQQYGAIIGDSTGGSMVLYLEDMNRSGSPGTWELNEMSLCAITAADLQVVEVPAP